VQPTARRRFLTGLGASLILPATAGSAFAKQVQPRELRLYNTNTGETFRGEYFNGEGYLRDAWDALNWFLRDHHVDAATEMDPKAFDLVWRLARQYRWARKRNVTINIHSAYRTKETNEKLRSEGAARNSLHMSGQALDVTVQGFGIYFLVNHVQRIGAGGIGTYWRGKFCHIDTGPPRRWYRRI